MKIGLVDADLLASTKHRFPNLALMKMSGYFKERGDEVSLLLSWDDIGNFDKIYVSRVFTHTNVPIDLDNYSNVEYGGTGYFFDKAPDLPNEIEHHFPDYHLYDDWISNMVAGGRKLSEFDEYTDFSHGFLTRGCFRKCEFCVNRKYSRPQIHSPVFEFLDPDKKYICLYDDNVLAHPQWEDMLNQLIATGKPFKFKQGLDIRLLTERKVEVLSKVKYRGEFTFAFDDYADRDLITEKLRLWRSKCNRGTKLYVLCAHKSQYLQDIIEVFERLRILADYECLPYIMRYEDYKTSEYYGMYVTLARWANQPSMFKKRTFREYCRDTAGGAAFRYMTEFEARHPQVALKYFDVRFCKDWKVRRRNVNVIHTECKQRISINGS